MHSLVMSSHSHDLIVTLVVKLIGAWFLDSELSTCFVLIVTARVVGVCQVEF